MNDRVHPSAGGGGGNRFESQVSRLIVADMIGARLSVLGGVPASVQPQTGPPCYDDQTVELALPDGSMRVMHIQCRLRQPFTAADEGFVRLLRCAEQAIFADLPTYLIGAKRLAVIVGDRSPAHRDMRELCELARANADCSDFESSLNAHRGRVLARWGECLSAAGSPRERVHIVLSCLQIHAFDLQGGKPPDEVRMVNNLASCWDPPNLTAAQRLSARILELVGYWSTIAATVDAALLRAELADSLPQTIRALNRRDRLTMLQDASQRRVAATIAALGVGAAQAEELARRTLDRGATEPPLHKASVVVGDIGVGKTTELERLYHHAVAAAINDQHAPIPVLIGARVTMGRSLLRVVQEEVGDLGDPAMSGVYLLVDGLDEAAIDPADLVRECASLLAQCPGSTVVLATRPQELPPGLLKLTVEPLSETESAALVSLIDTSATERSMRPEVEEVLRRPLFAVRYALSRRDGAPTPMQPAELVDAVGKEAAKGLSDETFELLTRLACLVIGTGGSDVALGQLDATVPQVARLSRSRILTFHGEAANFQLAVLTEWFAAQAILHDQAVLRSALATPVAARRWRYALSQALSQASPYQADQIMQAMLRDRPSTAAWVFKQALPPGWSRRANPAASTEGEAGRRIRTALRSWIDPWPILVEKMTDHGELPALGVAMDDSHLTTAWRSSHGSSTLVEHLPPDAHPLAARSPFWRSGQAGTPINGELWPWDWTFGFVKAQLERWITHLDLALDVAPSREELTWAYANEILKKDALLRRDPISISDLKAVVGRLRHDAPPGAVDVSYSNKWRLSEAEEFIAELEAEDVAQLDPPWPTPDEPPGGWVWANWSINRLLERVEATTTAGLNTYQAIVEAHLPRLAPDLSTYQLLPARVRGKLEPGRADHADERPSFMWYVEPLSAGNDNGSFWTVGPSPGDDWSDDTYWRDRRKQVALLRGDIAGQARLTLHGGEPDVFSRMPATAFALRLLKDDLHEFRWVSTPRSLDDRKVAKPHLEHRC